MGQRFYFDLKNEEVLIRDDEGVDASSLDEAIEEAHAGFRDIRGSEDALTPGDGWQLIIRDESGMTLSTISLDEVAFH